MTLEPRFVAGVHTQNGFGRRKRSYSSVPYFSVPSRGTGVRGSIRRSLLSDGNMIFAFFALGQVH